MRVVGYSRVSTEEQAATGAGMAAQREGITREADRRGWHLVGIYEDGGVSGRSLDGRPGVSAALSALAAGEADALVVLRLDRLSRSLIDFAGLLERARREGWAVIALDLGVDTTTPAGELVANVMGAVAQWERRVTGERTRAALAVRRSEGVRLGRPPSIPPDVRERMRTARTSGMTPKSRHGVRQVPLSAIVARRLWARLARQPDDALLFPAGDGGPLDRTRLYDVVHAAGERAGMSGLSDSTRSGTPAQRSSTGEASRRKPSERCSDTTRGSSRLRRTCISETRIFRTVQFSEISWRGQPRLRDRIPSRRCAMLRQRTREPGWR